MLDHYYTPRDDLEVFIPTPIRMHTSTDTEAIRTRTDADIVAKPRARGVNVIDLSALALEQLVAFDCDSDESDTESGSDDGYVSTLLRIQRALPPPQRKIAGARRVARAASAPVPTMRTGASSAAAAERGEGDGMDVDGAMSGRKGAREGELFQSITAIPGLQGASFEELRLETYRQSLAATGTARPQPALAPPLVIPPAWASTFVEAEDDEDEGEGDEASSSSSSSSSYSGSDSASGGGSGDDADPEIGDDADADVEMRDAFGKTHDPRKRHTPTLDPRKAFTFRAASYPPAGTHTQGQAGW